MTTHARALVLLTVFSIATMSLPAYGQDAIVHTGETVYVHTISSREVLRGTVLEANNGVFSLRVNGDCVDIPMDDVRRLDLQVRDPLMNGALIGGIAFGVLCVLTCGQGLESGDDLGQAVITNAVVGAAMGALIDYVKMSRKVVYERPRQVRTSALPAAAPLLTIRF